MTIVRRTLCRCLPVLAAVMPFVLSAASFAAKVDENVEKEARLEGYAQSVGLQEPGSAAPYYLLLVGLGIVAMIVLFKDAKRTHLD